MTDQSLEIDALAAAFYAAFDNRAGRAIDALALRSLFVTGASITRVTAGTIDTWDPDAFIAPRVALLTSGALTEFHEWETEGQTTILGSIASRRSHYRKQGLLNGEPYTGAGRKFIQLCRTGERWMISAIIWEDL